MPAITAGPGASSTSAPPRHDDRDEDEDQDEGENGGPPSSERRDRRVGPATALGRLVSVGRVLVGGLVAVHIRCVLLVSHILYSDDGVLSPERRAESMPALFDSGSFPARARPRQDQPAMYTSPARLVSCLGWAGTLKSGRRSRASFRHAYDYRLSHALLLYERPGVHKQREIVVKKLST